MSSTKTDRRTTGPHPWQTRRSHLPVHASLITNSILRLVLVTGLAALPLLSCAGCLIVPVRVNTVTRGAVADKHQKVTLDFIQKGVTTRNEVVEKLRWMDANVNDPHLFIGRWSDSRWGVVWMAASYYSADGGFNRKWNNHNLLVEFDDAGIAQESRVLSDKELAAELSAWAAQNLYVPLDLSSPIEVLVDRNGGARRAPTDQLLLGSDSFERRELEGKGRRNFRIPSTQIASLSLSRAIENSENPHPEDICLTFHFTAKTRAGQKFTVRTTMPAAVLVFEYFAQTHRAAAS